MRIQRLILGVMLMCIFITFTSCDKEDAMLASPELSEVSGEWELYRNENLESIIDGWTGTDWTYVDKWFKTIRNNTRFFIEFNLDGTFTEFYADVPTNSGVWGVSVDGRYYMEYVFENGIVNEFLEDRRYITKLCDNTYLLEIEGDDRKVDYFRKRGTTECSDLIVYNAD